MMNQNSNLRVATYHWAYSGGDSEFENKYHVTTTDSERLNRYCLEHSIVPLFILVEESIYFRDCEDRPAIKKLFKLAETQKIDLVLFNKIRVVSGSFRGFHRLLWELMNMGVKVQCVDEPFTTYFNNGRLIVLPEYKED